MSKRAATDAAFAAARMAAQFSYGRQERQLVASMMFVGAATDKMKGLAAQVAGFCSLTCQELSQEEERVRWLRPFVLIALLLAYPRCGDGSCSCSTQEVLHG